MEGEGDGGGLGGRLAATVAVLPMTSATASTAAMRTVGTCELFRLRTDHPPDMSEQSSATATQRHIRPEYQDRDGTAMSTQPPSL